MKIQGNKVSDVNLASTKLLEATQAALVEQAEQISSQASALVEQGTVPRENLPKLKDLIKTGKTIRRFLREVENTSSMLMSESATGEQVRDASGRLKEIAKEYISPDNSTALVEFVGTEHTPLEQCGAFQEAEGFQPTCGAVNIPPDDTENLKELMKPTFNVSNLFSFVRQPPVETQQWPPAEWTNVSMLQKTPKKSMTPEFKMQRPHPYMRFLDTYPLTRNIARPQHQFGNISLTSNLTTPTQPLAEQPLSAAPSQVENVTQTLMGTTPAGNLMIPVSQNATQRQAMMDLFSASVLPTPTEAPLAPQVNDTYNPETDALASRFSSVVGISEPAAQSSSFVSGSFIYSVVASGVAAASLIALLRTKKRYEKTKNDLEINQLSYNRLHDTFTENQRHLEESETLRTEAQNRSRELEGELQEVQDLNRILTSREGMITDIKIVGKKIKIRALKQLAREKDLDSTRLHLDITRLQEELQHKQHILNLTDQSLRDISSVAIQAEQRYNTEKHALETTIRQSRENSQDLLRQIEEIQERNRRTEDEKQNLLSEIDTIRHTITELQTALREQQSRHGEEIQSSHATIRNIQESMEEATQEKDRLEQRITELSETAREMDANLQRKSREYDELKRVSESASMLSMGDAQKHQREKAEMEQAIERLRGEVVRLSEEKDAKERELREAESVKREQAQTNALLMERMEQSASQASQLQSRIAELEQQLTEKEQVIVDLRRFQEELTTQQQSIQAELEMLKKRNATLENEKQAYLGQIRSLEEQAATLRQELEEKSALLVRVQGEKRTLLRQMKAMEAQHHDLGQRYRSLQKEAQEQQQQYASVVANREQLQQAFQTQQEEAKKKREELHSAIGETLDYSMEKRLETVNEIHKVAENIHMHNLRMEYALKTIGEIDTDISALVAETSAIKKRQIERLASSSALLMEKHRHNEELKTQISLNELEREELIGQLHLLESQKTLEEMKIRAEKRLSKENEISLETLQQIEKEHLQTEMQIQKQIDDLKLQYSKKSDEIASFVANITRNDGLIQKQKTIDDDQTLEEENNVAVLVRDLQEKLQERTDLAKKLMKDFKESVDPHSFEDNFSAINQDASKFAATWNKIIQAYEDLQSAMDVDVRVVMQAEQAERIAWLDQQRRTLQLQNVIAEGVQAEKTLSEYQQRIQGLEERVAAASHEYEEARAKNEELTAQLAGLRAQLQVSDERAAQMEQQNVHLQQQMEAVSAEHNDMSVRLQAAIAEKAELIESTARETENFEREKTLLTQRLFELESTLTAEKQQCQRTADDLNSQNQTLRQQLSQLHEELLRSQSLAKAGEASFESQRQAYADRILQLASSLDQSSLAKNAAETELEKVRKELGLFKLNSLRSIVGDPKNLVIPPRREAEPSKDEIETRYRQLLMSYIQTKDKETSRQVSIQIKELEERNPWLEDVE